MGWAQFPSESKSVPGMSKGQSIASCRFSWNRKGKVFGKKGNPIRSRESSPGNRRGQKKEVGRNPVHETCICGGFLPPHYGMATALVCGPNSDLSLLPFTGESHGTWLWEGKGHGSLFQEWRIGLTGDVSLVFTETLEELFCFKPQKLAQLGPCQLCQEPGRVTLFGSGCPVSSYLIRSCIICITEISVLGNESDCGEPRLPLYGNCPLSCLACRHLSRKQILKGFVEGKWEEATIKLPLGAR